ncbi:heat shock 70 kDa protein 12A-like [Mercenaria mercenaria]|uniref:heat shock 70 kDa protein 12A-like n=1 Tax=Mercenaria mercenaria TaxID=6596 RepID=UPI00234F30B4|nr:heat shock 70 kDa protein 12A-like [Mercenaria mercenaria]
MSLLVAAIDFGTTFSGFAFSFKHDFDRDPLKVSAKQWNGGQMVSMKTPTCAMIKSDGKTLEAFGYEAENKYEEYALTKSLEEYYYFRRFKMMLHGKNNIKRDVTIKDQNGRPLLAQTVFSLSIKYLRDDLLKTAGSITGIDLKKHDIHWVLTVPAIWNDAAKQFMREAAQKAGIQGQKLTIALEPEAASLYCRHLPVERCGSDEVSLAQFPVGTKYLVLDAGGGTVDITVHEVMENGKVKELEKASGGAWGGTKVDDAFELFLTEIAGNSDVMRKLKVDYMEDFIDMFRYFELKKREVRPENTGTVTFQIPASFKELVKKIAGKKLPKAVSKSKYKGKVEVVTGKLKVDVDLLKQLFHESVKSVVDHVGSLLRKPSVQGCKAILMVGGFSESPMLQMNVKKSFPELKLIIPDEAGLAVLKGAVIFGHNPTAIDQRICKFTYGVNVGHFKSPFCTHAPTRVVRVDEGNLICYDLFMITARIGQSVTLGEEQEEHLVQPIYENQSGIHVEVYATSSPNPQLVTEDGCSKIGQLHVDIPDTSVGTDREFGVSFIFGRTEIEVKVVDKESGEITRTFVDFLQNI